MVSKYPLNMTALPYQALPIVILNACEGSPKGMFRFAQHDGLTCQLAPSPLGRGACFCNKKSTRVALK
jgi:hypothetical protein